VRVEAWRNRGEFCCFSGWLGKSVGVCPGSNVRGALLQWPQKRGLPAGISNLTL